MSIDFSIKPSNTPIAAPIASSTGTATTDAVKTQLPKPLTVSAVDATGYIRHDPQSARNSVAREVVIDRAAASFVYRTIDERTNEIISQFPDDAILRRRTYFEELDRQRDAPQIEVIDRSI